MKQILFVLAFIFSSILLQSQNFYFKINGGYGIPLIGQTIEIPDISGYDYESPIILTNYFIDKRSGLGASHEDKNPITFGQGINYGINAGYYIRKNWGVDLGLSYLISDKFKANYDYHLDADYYEHYKIYSRIFRINPGIFVTTEMKKINPYFKIGMLLGTGYIIINEKDASRSVITLKDSKLYGGLALGYNATVGSKYKLGERIGLFCDVSLINMKYTPSKGKLTKYYYYNNDQLYHLSTSRKEIVFKNQIDPKSELDETKPREYIKIDYPFSSIELNIGLVYNFK